MTLDPCRTPWGKYAPGMRYLVQQHIRGKHVYDLGCGFGAPHLRILAPAAAHVTCIDRAVGPVLAPQNATVIEAGFETVRMPDIRTSVAYLSWPWVPDHPTIVRVAEVAASLVFLGANDGITACGGYRLAEVMLRRPCLAYLAHPLNDLIILGPMSRRAVREPTPGERHMLR